MSDAPVCPTDEPWLVEFFAAAKAAEAARAAEAAKAAANGDNVVHLGDPATAYARAQEALKAAYARAHKAKATADREGTEAARKAAADARMAADAALRRLNKTPKPADHPSNKPKPQPLPSIIGQPFRWRDPASIPPREWVYGRHYIRRYLTATVAPGALGKSSLALVEAVDMVTGRGLLSDKPTRLRHRVFYWNGEDPQEEIDRRIAAICRHYGIDEAALGDGLFARSGRDVPICMASETKLGLIVNTNTRDTLLRDLVDNRIDVLILDPFVATHEISENDNVKVNVVARAFGWIAEKANASVELIHHTRKGQLGEDRGVDDARGAKALTDAARSVRVLNPMQAAEAEALGINPELRRSHFRVDDAKTNLVPPSSAAVWRKLQSVDLGNAGANQSSDHVGVVIAWTKPSAMEGLTAEHVATLRQRLTDGAPARRDVRSPDWAGHALAAVMGIDTQSAAARKRLGATLDALVKERVLEIVLRGNGKGREVECFVPSLVAPGTGLSEPKATTRDEMEALVA